MSSIRPATATLSPVSVPIIDMALLLRNSVDLQEADHAERTAVVKAILHASRTSGFFYAVNHGIDLDALLAHTNRLHATMSDEEKRALAIRAYRPDSERVRMGYSLAKPGQKAVESLCYLNPSFTPEHAKIRAKTPLHEVNVWPDAKKHQGFKEFAEQYYRDVLKLSRALLRGYALALNKDENFFDSFLTDAGTLSSVALIRYPFLQDYPEDAIKLVDGEKLSFEQHRDVSLITVLYQTAPQNLQVHTKLGWQDIPMVQAGYLINAGTYMEHITHGYIPAPLHRVKFINAERLSLPFFVNLDDDSSVPPFRYDDDVQPASGQERAALPYGQYLQMELRQLIISNGQT